MGPFPNWCLDRPGLGLSGSLDRLRCRVSSRVNGSWMATVCDPCVGRKLGLGCSSIDNRGKSTVSLIQRVFYVIY